MAHISANKKRLDDLEKASEGIRRDFDQFFLGLTRRPPTASQAQLAGTFRKLKEEELRDWNTQDRFRFNQIHARFVSMERMWARTMKQIEDGTYKRDKFKVAQMKKREAEQAASQVDSRPANTMDPMDSIDVDMSFDEDSISINSKVSEAPVQRPRPQPRPVAAAPASSDMGGLSEQKLQQLHRVYMEAKRRTGEKSSLTVDTLRSQVQKQVPAIKAKHKCEAVDFKVVLKDGKAMLKAIPK